MGLWLLRLSAKILALLRLLVNIFQLRLTKKLKINFFCFKELNINKPVFFVSLKQNKGLRIISGWNAIFFWKILTFDRSSPHYSARLMRFGSRGQSEIFFSDTPPKCLERDCVVRRLQGLGMAMSTVASEKNRELLFIGNVFYKQWHISACCFTSISRARPPESRKY